MPPHIPGFATGADLDLSTRDFALPDNISSGQLLMVFIGMDDAPATGTLTLDDPDDEWTFLANNASVAAFAGTVMRATIAYKQANGNETNITVLSSAPESVAYVGIRITDYDAATPPAIAGPVTSGSGGGPPSLNPAGWDVEDTLWIAVTFSDPGWAFTTAPPANYENFHEAHWADNNGVAVAIASRVNAAGFEDPGVFAFGGFPDTSSYTIAIRPGADGPTPLDFSMRLSGGAANANATLSIGGTESSVRVVGNELFDDVSQAERVTTFTDYRLIYVHNEDVATGGLVGYISGQLEADRSMAIGVATQSAGATVPAIANDRTPPAGVTFSTAESAGSGVNLGVIAPGEKKGVWLRRTVNADLPADITNPWAVAFEVTRQ